MGTPEFAVPSLELLVKNDVHVVAVITAPDKPQGRGQKIVYSPVKACALQYNIPCVTTMTGARAIVEALAAKTINQSTVHSLQELHALRSLVAA